MKVVQFVDGSGRRGAGVVLGNEVYRTAAVSDSLELLLDESRARGAGDAGTRIGTVDELDRRASAGLASLRIPIDPSEVWGAGVTSKKSAEFRDEDTSTSKGIYDMVYSAPRPELFFKGRAAHCVGPNEAATIRADSTFTAPEPELALVLARDGKILGYTLCDDVSAWDIERENPLYLPQSKIFYGCVVLGPTIVTRDEIGDVSALTLRCAIHRGGQVIFDESVGLDQIKRSFQELIDYLRLNNPIQDGAVLSTGTGIIVPPELALREGDEIEMVCEPIGTLRHAMRKLPRDWTL
jgi:2-dehydro-3-deoxy-D-arabinonate dehydratase